jgi:hypothetical protein
LNRSQMYLAIDTFYTIQKLVLVHGEPIVVISIEWNLNLLLILKTNESQPLID